MYNNNKTNKKATGNRNNKKKTSNVMTMKIDFSGMSEEAVEFVKDTLLKTPFSNISIPINTFKRFIDSNTDKSDVRVSTAGYIIKCEENESGDMLITFIVYNHIKDIIEKFKNPFVSVVYNENKTYKTIIKIIINQEE
jgi:hypothetical protein